MTGKMPVLLCKWYHSCDAWHEVSYFATGQGNSASLSLVRNLVLRSLIRFRCGRKIVHSVNYRSLFLVLVKNPNPVTFQGKFRRIEPGLPTEEEFAGSRFAVGLQPEVTLLQFHDNSLNLLDGSCKRKVRHADEDRGQDENCCPKTHRFPQMAPSQRKLAYRSHGARKDPLTLPSPARGEGFQNPLPRREGEGGG